MRALLAIFLLMMFFGINPSLAQKNQIYVSFGSSDATIINYERLIHESWHSDFRSRLKLSAGKLKFPLYGRGSKFRYTDYMYSISTSFLWGSKGGSFELNAGLALLSFDEPDPVKENTTVLPVLGIGYRLRIQHLLVRAGLSLPEGFHFGIGYIFKDKRKPYSQSK